MDGFNTRRNQLVESGRASSSHRPPIAAVRKPGPRLHPKTRHVEVLSSDCGCTIPRNINSQGKLGSLGKIWPLFRIFPADFSTGAEGRRNAVRERTKSVTARVPISLSPNMASSRSFDSPQYAQDRTPASSAGQSEALGDTRTSQSVASDHASSSSEGLQRTGDIFDTELETRSKRLDVEFLDSSYVQWEELSGALEREFEMLGHPCRCKKNPSDTSTKFSPIASEDWAVGMVKEELHAPSENISPRSTSSTTTRRASQALGIGDSPTGIYHHSLRDRFHRATFVQNKLSMKTEVGLNFVSISQFGEVMGKAGASLHEFCSTLIKVKRGTMKRSRVHNSMDEEDLIGWMILRPLLPQATFALPHHIKFGIQACINEAVFRHFQSEAYGLHTNPLLTYDTHDHSSARSRLRQVTFLKDFYACDSLSPEEMMDPESADFNENFQLFCRKKLKAVQKAIGWGGRWPSELWEAFLESMKRVWMAHKLALAFEKPAIMFHVNGGAEWDDEFMEAAIGVRGGLFYEIVEFMVLPGFSLREGGGVVKSKVYLKPKECRDTNTNSKARMWVQ